MHICLLTDKYPPDIGGLAVSARRLAHGLAASGHQVTVARPVADRLPGQAHRRPNGPVHLLEVGAERRPDDTRTAWFEALAEAHRRQPFDLLHGFYLVEAGFMAVFTGRYLARPTVVSARGNDLDRSVFHPNHFAAIHWALQQAGVVTINSQDLARKARALVPDRPVRLVANGVDADRFTPGPPDPALQASLGLDPARPVMGFVGEARRKKGLPILLLAYEQLAAGRPAARLPALLFIGGARAGDDDSLRLFQARHPDLPVRQVDKQSHEAMPAFYRLLDLLVLPSLRDGLPNALLEGMAAGRPVLTTPVGGIADVVHHGDNGWLVPAGDPAALAAAMAHLLAEPSLRAALGRAARRKAQADFTPAAELAAYQAIYRSLVQP